MQLRHKFQDINVTTKNRKWFSRWLRRSMLALVVLLAVVGIGRLTQVWWDSRLTGARGPYLQNVTPSAITVRWQTLQPEIGEVDYGTTGGDLTQRVREKEATRIHQLRIKGLSAATRYFYRIGHDGKVEQGGDDYWFYTAPQPGAVAPYRFWVQGDPGYYNDGAKAVRAAMEQWVATHPRAGRPPFDLWLTTGDNGYRSGRNSDYQNGLFNAYPTLLRDIPYVPVYGNHDARRWTFYRLFTFPEQGEGGGVASGSPHYFSFDYGNVHFIVLDSQSTSLSRDGAMHQWLQRDLAATHQTWRVVLFHHPPYSRATHNSDRLIDSLGRLVRMRENFLPLLEQYGVDLVLTGHSHIYERSYLLRCHYGKSNSFKPSMIVQPGEGNTTPYRKPLEPAPHDGTVYAVVGSTSNLDNGPLNHPANLVVRHQRGALMLDVNGDTLNARFINSDGKVSDHFTIVKSAEVTASDAKCVGP